MCLPSALLRHTQSLQNSHSQPRHSLPLHCLPQPHPPLSHHQQQLQHEVFTTDPTQTALGTPASLCDNYVYVADVTIVDGTAMTPGQDFVKTWKIKNTGDCTWGDGYGLIYSYGEKMSGEAVPFGTVVEAWTGNRCLCQFQSPRQDWRIYQCMANGKPQRSIIRLKENFCL